MMSLQCEVFDMYAHSHTIPTYSSSYLSEHCRHVPNQPPRAGVRADLRVFLVCQFGGMRWLWVLDVIVDGTGSHESRMDWSAGAIGWAGRWSWGITRSHSPTRERDPSQD